MNEFLFSEMRWLEDFERSLAPIVEMQRALAEPFSAIERSLRPMLEAQKVWKVNRETTAAIERSLEPTMALQRCLERDFTAMEEIQRSFNQFGEANRALQMDLRSVFGGFDALVRESTHVADAFRVLTDARLTLPPFLTEVMNLGNDLSNWLPTQLSEFLSESARLAQLVVLPVVIVPEFPSALIKNEIERLAELQRALRKMDPPRFTLDTLRPIGQRVHPEIEREYPEEDNQESGFGVGSDADHDADLSSATQDCIFELVLIESLVREGKELVAANDDRLAAEPYLEEVRDTVDSLIVKLRGRLN